MQRGWICVLAVLVLFLSAVPAGSAQTKWQVRQTFNFENEPLDMVVATRSRRVYVLTDKGEIQVYALDGKLKGKIDVGTDVFRIMAGANEEFLFLLKRNSKSMQAITIDLTENINIQGSPFKGPPNAPVTVAVFSDFQ